MAADTPSNGHPGERIDEHLKRLDAAAAENAAGVAQNAEDIAGPPADPTVPVGQSGSGYTIVGNANDSYLVETPKKVTNVLLWEQIVGAREEGLATRAEVLNLRGDVVDLKQHVNDDVESLQRWMNTALALKADKDELLTSLGERLMSKGYIRWGVGIAFATLIGTATVNNWWHVIVQFLLKGT